MKILIFLLIISLSFFNSSLFAQVFPNDIKWKQLESKHFTVVYHINDAIAFRTINIAESIHQELYKKFRIPDNIHTYIIIIDSSDIANGVATVLPANIIVLYYTGIEFYSEFSLLNTYNWWKELILHEYIHILHLNQRKDINRFCSFIGLKYFILNPLLPAFCIEGTAVCFETEYTRMGRARAYYTEMVIRTAVYENNLPGLDDIAFWNVRKFLPGEGPYIWGGAFSRFILNKYGKDKLLSIYYNHSGCISSCIGYTRNSCISAISLSPLNGIANSILGKEIYDLWDMWILNLKLKYRKKIKKLWRKGITRIKRISGFYYKIFDLVFKNERIYFSGLNPDNGYNIYMIKDNKEEIIVRNRFANSLASLNQTIYFTGYEYYKNYYSFLELFKIDSDSSVQITQKARLKGIFEYNDKFFIAIKDNINKIQVIISDNRGRVIDKIIEFDKVETVGDIVYVRNEHSIYFILKQNEDFVDIFKLNLSTKKIERLTKNPAIEYSLFSDNTGLYFVSDFDGIYNLYYYSFDKKEFYKLSNFITGILRIIKDKRKFYVVAYSSYGYYIGEILTTSLVKEEVDYNNETKTFSNYVEKDRIEIKSFHTSASETYSPFRSMLSTILYAPAIMLNTLNDNIIGGVRLYFSDILFYHIFLLNFLYDFYYERMYFEIDYYNYLFDPNLNINIYNYYDLDGGSFLFRFFKLKWQYYLSLYSGINIEREFYKYFYNSFIMKITYNSSQSYPLSVDYERGVYTGVLFNIYEKLLGSEESLYTMELWCAKFVPFFFSHHTLKFDFKAGFLLNKSRYKPFEIRGPIFYDIPLHHKYSLKSYIGLKIRGKNYTAGIISYSFPIVWVEQGYRLLPFMLEKLWTKVFYEFAQVFNRLPKINKFYDVAGLEFHTTIKMLYRIGFDMGLGISKSLKKAREYTYYITINLGF